MKYLIRILASTLVFLLFFQVLPTSGQEQQEKKPWTGKLVDGTVITKEDLVGILAAHKRWLETNKKEGQQANLTGANLRGANLTRAFLWGANLTNADLRAADLTEARLEGANLTEANLRGANLTRAFLWGTNLTKADLRGTNLTGAELLKTDLTEADLGDANQAWAADMITTPLIVKEAEVIADLTQAELKQLKMMTVREKSEKLRKERDRLRKERDRLKEVLALFRGKVAKVLGANLNVAVYEPKPGSVPYIPSMSVVKNLSTMTFSKSPHGLNELREDLKKAGLREQEREITYAIEHTKTAKLTTYTSNAGPINTLSQFIKAMGIEFLGWIKYFFIELTCQYGMTPWRPLFLLLFVSIPIFTIPYFFCLRKESKDGIWKAWSKERRRKDLPEDKDESSKPLLISGWPAIKVAFYFSILSAFSIGWRELNVGNWIARIQRHEFTYRATGWARTVSGIQSLLSVYLLALWALTYFSRPFG